VAMFRDGSTIHEVMTRAQIESVRAMSKARNAAAWTESWPEMARKTVVRRLAKYLKLTPEAREIIERDDEREFNFSTPVEPTARTANLKDALRAQVAKPPEPEIEGEAVAVPPEPDAPGPTVTEDATLGQASAPEQAEPVKPADRPCPLSPYDPPSACVLTPGHKGLHRGKEKESW